MILMNAYRTIGKLWAMPLLAMAAPYIVLIFADVIFVERSKYNFDSRRYDAIIALIAISWFALRASSKRLYVIKLPPYLVAVLCLNSFFGIAHASSYTTGKNYHELGWALLAIACAFSLSIFIISPNANPEGDRAKHWFKLTAIISGFLIPITIGMSPIIENITKASPVNFLTVLACSSLVFFSTIQRFSSKNSYNPIHSSLKFDQNGLLVFSFAVIYFAVAQYGAILIGKDAVLTLRSMSYLSLSIFPLAIVLIRSNQRLNIAITYAIIITSIYAYSILHRSAVDYAATHGRPLVGF